MKRMKQLNILEQDWGKYSKYYMKTNLEDSNQGSSFLVDRHLNKSITSSNNLFNLNKFVNSYSNYSLDYDELHPRNSIFNLSTSNINHYFVSVYYLNIHIYNFHNNYFINNLNSILKLNASNSVLNNKSESWLLSNKVLLYRFKNLINSEKTKPSFDLILKTALTFNFLYNLNTYNFKLISNKFRSYLNSKSLYRKNLKIKLFGITKIINNFEKNFKLITSNKRTKLPNNKNLNFYFLNKIKKMKKPGYKLIKMLKVKYRNRRKRRQSLKKINKFTNSTLYYKKNYINKFKNKYESITNYLNNGGVCYSNTSNDLIKPTNSSYLMGKKILRSNEYLSKKPKFFKKKFLRRIIKNRLKLYKLFRKKLNLLVKVNKNTNINVFYKNTILYLSNNKIKYKNKILTGKNIKNLSTILEDTKDTNSNYKPKYFNKWFVNEDIYVDIKYQNRVIFFYKKFNIYKKYEKKSQKFYIFNKFKKKNYTKHYTKYTYHKSQIYKNKKVIFKQEYRKFRRLNRLLNKSLNSGFKKFLNIELRKRFKKKIHNLKSTRKLFNMRRWWLASKTRLRHKIKTWRTWRRGIRRKLITWSKPPTKKHLKNINYTLHKKYLINNEYVNLLYNSGLVSLYNYMRVKTSEINKYKTVDTVKNENINNINLPLEVSCLDLNDESINENWSNIDLNQEHGLIDVVGVTKKTAHRFWGVSKKFKTPYSSLLVFTNTSNYFKLKFLKSFRKNKRYNSLIKINNKDVVYDKQHNFEIIKKRNKINTKYVYRNYFNYNENKLFKNKTKKPSITKSKLKTEFFIINKFLKRPYRFILRKNSRYSLIYMIRSYYKGYNTSYARKIRRWHWKYTLVRRFANKISKLGIYNLYKKRWKNYLRCKNYLNLSFNYNIITQKIYTDYELERFKFLTLIKQNQKNVKYFLSKRTKFFFKNMTTCSNFYYFKKNYVKTGNYFKLAIRFRKRIKFLFRIRWFKTKIRRAKKKHKWTRRKYEKYFYRSYFMQKRRSSILSEKNYEFVDNQTYKQLSKVKNLIKEDLPYFTNIKVINFITTIDNNFFLYLLSRKIKQQSSNFNKHFNDLVSKLDFDLSTHKNYLDISNQNIIKSKILLNFLIRTGDSNRINKGLGLNFKKIVLKKIVKNNKFNFFKKLSKNSNTQNFNLYFNKAIYGCVDNVLIKTFKNFNKSSHKLRDSLFYFSRLNSINKIKSKISNLMGAKNIKLRYYHKNKIFSTSNLNKKNIKILNSKYSIRKHNYLSLLTVNKNKKYSINYTNVYIRNKKTKLNFKFKKFIKKVKTRVLQSNNRFNRIHNFNVYFNLKRLNINKNYKSIWKVSIFSVDGSFLKYKYFKNKPSKSYLLNIKKQVNNYNKKKLQAVKNDEILKTDVGLNGVRKLGLITFHSKKIITNVNYKWWFKIFKIPSKPTTNHEVEKFKYSFFRHGYNNLPIFSLKGNINGPQTDSFLNFFKKEHKNLRRVKKVIITNKNQRRFYFYRYANMRYFSRNIKIDKKQNNTITLNTKKVFKYRSSRHTLYTNIYNNWERGNNSLYRKSLKSFRNWFLDDIYMNNKVKLHNNVLCKTYKNINKVFRKRNHGKFNNYLKNIFTKKNKIRSYSYIFKNIFQNIYINSFCEYKVEDKLLGVYSNKVADFLINPLNSFYVKNKNKNKISNNFNKKTIYKIYKKRLSGCFRKEKYDKHLNYFKNAKNFYIKPKNKFKFIKKKVFLFLNKDSRYNIKNNLKRINKLQYKVIKKALLSSVYFKTLFTFVKSKYKFFRSYKIKKIIFLLLKKFYEYNKLLSLKNNKYSSLEIKNFKKFIINSNIKVVSYLINTKNYKYYLNFKNKIFKIRLKNYNKVINFSNLNYFFNKINYTLVNKNINKLFYFNKIKRNSFNVVKNKITYNLINYNSFSQKINKFNLVTSYSYKLFLNTIFAYPSVLMLSPYIRNSNNNYLNKLDKNYRKYMKIWYQYPKEEEPISNFFFFNHLITSFIETKTSHNVSLSLHFNDYELIPLEYRVILNLWSQRVQRFHYIFKWTIRLKIIMKLLYLVTAEKDLHLLMKIITKLTPKIQYRSHRRFFKFIIFIFRAFFVFLFLNFNVKGMQFEFAGKISVTGNARTRKMYYKLGKPSRSTYTYSTKYVYKTVSTYMGVLGIKVWIFH